MPPISYRKSQECIISRDNCKTALILSFNSMFALIFLTLHIYPCFSKSKAPSAPLSYHRELKFNKGPKKCFKKREKGRKTKVPLIQITHLLSSLSVSVRDIQLRLDASTYRR